MVLPRCPESTCAPASSSALRSSRSLIVVILSAEVTLAVGGVVWPPRMEMVHRPVAVADRQAVCTRDRRGDEILGGACGGDEVEPLGEPGGNRGRKRAARAVRIARRDAGRGKPRLA